MNGWWITALLFATILIVFWPCGLWGEYEDNDDIGYF